VKPGAFDDLVALVGALNLYWVRLNQRPDVERG
jgi:hypothetical protein